ncbi:MAG: 4Fe-4S dicluster domain-containing protein [Candidatus Omnitrophica bacterium]|nr:4Fe-4S dicluster domain-containing protein [Candidatus Omnitrophota bacterium]
MRKPKLRELKEAIRALIKGPCTIDFPKTIPAVPEGYRGKPEYNESGCVGCGTCSIVCPGGNITIEEDTSGEVPVRRLVVASDNCIFCGQCERNCITSEGIKLTDQYELSNISLKEPFSEVEKELLLCEMCGAVIGPLDHIRWIARRIGPALFSNPTLMLTMLRNPTGERHVSSPSDTGDGEAARSDRIRILCARCRRITTLER